MVLGLESKIALAHDDDLGVHEHGLVADAVDVVLDELELFLGFCESGRGVRLHISIISTQKIKSIIALPLHPCSVSMPSPCATTTMSVGLLTRMAKNVSCNGKAAYVERGGGERTGHFIVCYPYK